MKICIRNKIITTILALILFQQLLLISVSALPLTETIYTIPEDGIEILLHEEIHKINKHYRKDHIGIGFGILPDFSFWFMFDYLHGGVVKLNQSAMGDTFLKLWYYTGDWNNDTIHMGLLLQFRFPTGKNAYNNTKWRNLSLGNNEVKLGLVSQFDILKILYTHFNFFYIFRQGNNEDFYAGFEVLADAKKFKNDFLSFSIAFNTDLIYPVIPYAEVYGSFRFYRGKIKADDIPIEGAAIDPILISIGLRYFFSNSIFIGFYSILNPLWTENYTKVVYGLDFGVQF